MLSLLTLAASCAADVHPDTMRRIVHVESSANPYAIGVVGERLARQPRSLSEAKQVVAELESRGANYSVGLAQINRSNFRRYGVTAESAFDPCTNLRVGAAILRECFARARASRDEQAALQAAFSCYYSGNFVTGFREGYVARVLAAPAAPASSSGALTASSANAAVSPRATSPTAELSSSGITRRTPLGNARAEVFLSDTGGRIADGQSSLLF